MSFGGAGSLLAPPYPLTYIVGAGWQITRTSPLQSDEHHSLRAVSWENGRSDCLSSTSKPVQDQAAAMTCRSALAGGGIPPGVSQGAHTTREPYSQTRHPRLLPQAGELAAASPRQAYPQGYPAGGQAPIPRGVPGTPGTPPGTQVPPGVPLPLTGGRGTCTPRGECATGST